MQIVNDIQNIIRQAQQFALRQINTAMLTAYWQVGRRIIEEEQQGESRAAYGKALIKTLSEELQKEFGKGFSVDNLQNMRRFYATYPMPHVKTLTQGSVNPENTLNKFQVGNYETLSRNLQVPEFKLSWSHYLLLIRISEPEERAFYEIEAVKNRWSLRELKRQFDSALYLRLALSKDKDGIMTMASKGQVIENSKDAVKDPYILEFLDLPDHYRYSENELEQQLIDKLEHFLLELGTGFTFVARQKRITLDEKHFYIDLVFYNRILRCFVVIDLKIGELKHQDIGQVQMYVNYYDRFVKMEDEHKTIGIIMCRDKSETLVEITLPQENDQIFASRYNTILPDKEVLKKLLSEKY
jgi:predicted nuclease of restriction endonuclease-like (RecB) superfamily